VIWEGGALDGPTHRLRARGVAYLPQRHPVFSRLSVQGNLELAAAFQTRRGRRREVEAALAGVPALRERRRQLAATLSGGERQQLALACSLVGGPELLLADEPTAGVAGPVRLSLLERLRETARNQDAAVVVVEHHVEAASQVADLVVGLRLGRVAVECEASAFDEAARRRVFLE